MSELEQARADCIALEKILKKVIAFIDPQPPALPVLKLTREQVPLVTTLLREAYRCLWSEHPGATS